MLCGTLILTFWGATASFADEADSALRCWVCRLQAGGVCTDVEASTALNGVVDSYIEGPAASKVVTPVLWAAVVPGGFDLLVPPY